MIGRDEAHSRRLWRSCARDLDWRLGLAGQGGVRISAG